MQNLTILILTTFMAFYSIDMKHNRSTSEVIEKQVFSTSPDFRDFNTFFNHEVTTTTSTTSGTSVSIHTYTLKSNYYMYTYTSDPESMITVDENFIQDGKKMVWRTQFRVSCQPSSGACGSNLCRIVGDANSKKFSCTSNTLDPNCQCRGSEVSFEFINHWAERRRVGF